MIPRKHLVLTLLLFIGLFSLAQDYSVSGTVKDEATGEPLAFVNITLNDGKYGGVSDIDGKFQLGSYTKPHSISFSYVGYEAKRIELDGPKSGLKVRLKKKQFELLEVEILAGENPAHRIIRNVMDNRKENDPEKLKSFSYTAYDKMFFTADIDSIKYRESEDLDSNQMEIKDFFESQHLFLMETVTERKFMSPNKNYENVTASRISGFKDPIIVFMISQMQSTSFYNEVFQIFNKTYVNPISRGCINKYFYWIEDTTYTDRNDTVFIISYKPRRNTNFDGLKGLLYINSHKWAIQNAIANPAEGEGGISINIQQKYELINDSTWFPVQLNTDLIFRNAAVTATPDSADSVAGAKPQSFALLGIGKSYIRDIEINPELVKRQFRAIEVEIEPDAHEKPEGFWNAYRIDSLTDQEKKTYHFIDSIGKEENFDKIARSFETMLNRQIPYKWINIDLDKFFRYSGYEGIYLGLGAHTNEKFSKVLSFGGYWGYGFKDKRAKYGVDARVNIDRFKDIYIKGHYQFDLEESAGVSFFDDQFTLLKTENFRSFHIRRMNNTLSYGANIGFRALRYMKLDVGFRKQEKDAYQDYLYVPQMTEIAHQKFNFTELRVGMRYAYKEKFIKTRRAQVSLGTSYPIVWLQYTKGFDGVLDGEYDYQRVDLKLEKSFFMKFLGTSTFRIMGGFIDGDVPYCNLFNGNGSYRTFTLWAPYSFATMRMNEFLSDRYAALYFTHNFGKLLHKGKWFKPEIAISSNVAFGSLEKPELHYNVDFKTLEKGYYESGLMINSILDLQLYTIGLGAYYRYGPYSLPNTGDNFAYKVSLIFQLERMKR